MSFGTNLGFNPQYPDSAYDIGFFDGIPHTASTLTLSFFASGAGWQGGDDESWAIDNLSVFVEPAAVPEPMTSALLLVGAAGFAARRLRRRSRQ